MQVSPLTDAEIEAKMSAVVATTVCSGVWTDDKLEQAMNAFMAVTLRPKARRELQLECVGFLISRSTTRSATQTFEF